MPDELEREWLAVDTLRQAHVPAMHAEVSAFFTEQEEAMLARIEAERTKPRVQSTKGVDVDLTAWIDALFARLEPLVAAIILEGFESGALRIGTVRGGQLLFDNDHVREAIAAQVIGSSYVQQTTEEELQRALDAIQTGLTEEQSYEEIQRAVRGVFASARRGRAEMIAQTAAVAGFESGQQRAYEEAGVTKKRWLSQRDGRVRTGHLEADGQEVAVSAAFRVRASERHAYEKLKHPGDKQGSPANVIRCRCTSLPVIN